MMDVFAGHICAEREPAHLARLYTNWGRDPGHPLPERKLLRGWAVLGLKRLGY